MQAGRRSAASGTSTGTTATTLTARGAGGTTTNGTLNGGGGSWSKRGATASSASSSTPAADFHPKLIASQIVCLQCFHYFILAVLFQINHFLYGKSVTLDRIFTDQHVHIWNVTGWPDCLAILVASVVGSVFLTIIVEKSKKCLDFSVTLFLLHLILCTYYGGFPHRLEWWVVHILGTILMTVTGEYLCSRREMEDIPLLQI